MFLMCRRHRRHRHPPPNRAIFGANRDANPSRNVRDGARSPLPLCSHKKQPY